MRLVKAYEEEPKVYGEYFCISNMGRKMKVTFHPEAKWHPQDIPMYADGEIVREWIDEQADDCITHEQLIRGLGTCRKILSEAAEKETEDYDRSVMHLRVGYLNTAMIVIEGYKKILASTPQGGDKKIK